MSKTQSWWEQSDWKDLPDWDGTDDDDGMGRYCNHSWKPTVLVMSTVYDCEYCGAKAEELGINPKDQVFGLPDRSRR